MAAPTEITPSQLLRLIGTPDAPTIIDVTTDEDHALDPALIPGAIRLPHDDLPLIHDHAGPRTVVVCQKGRKLSHGVAAWLRTDGIAAEVLEGGMIGWRQAEGPAVPDAAVPTRQGGATLWVTRHRPKIDRIACPWLIRRFVDPNARFLFVPPSEVTLVAEKFAATPFDVPDVPFSHQGEACTFDTMCDQFGLTLPALDTLSRVIRGADTNRHDLAPEAAGLLAISVGLSRMFRNDLEQLEAGLTLYDALYRWARDGQGETHDWHPEATA
ncbi:chromate resistance protein ChrB domain-containing protein [Pseudooceanicola sp. MF1-13]|uniref:chromate resistance protein ChrB domain-containing protein n=1 Tax=Pseudooceanicola sp. MF1-13 TaxID=3379095 RepID=UPI003891474B